MIYDAYEAEHDAHEAGVLGKVSAYVAARRTFSGKWVSSAALPTSIARRPSAAVYAEFVTGR